MQFSYTMLDIPPFHFHVRSTFPKMTSAPPPLLSTSTAFSSQLEAVRSVALINTGPGSKPSPQAMYKKSLAWKPSPNAMSYSIRISHLALGGIELRCCQPCPSLDYVPLFMMNTHTHAHTHCVLPLAASQFYSFSL